MGAFRSLHRLMPARWRREPPLHALDERPEIVHYTPSSILASPEGRQFWYCNGRKRYATCSGVSWFHDDYLACVNVLGNAIHVYRFDRAERSLTPIQTLSGAPRMLKPENICFSPDGSLVAITDMGTGDMQICRVDSRSHAIDLEGSTTVKEPTDRTCHGVSFSSCGRFVAYTTLDKPGVVRVFRVEVENGEIRVERFQVFGNTLHPLVPKGIDFAKDGSRVAICYAPNVSRAKVRQPRGRLEIRAFDPQRGIASEPLSVSSWRHAIRGTDDVRFFGGDAFVVLTQQGDDSALVVSVDPRTSRLGRATQTLRNPTACLSFPHGAGVSPDGRWVAITNYGDDKLGIYSVPAFGGL